MTAALLNQTPLERNCQKAIDTFGYLVIGADRRRYQLGDVVFLNEYHSPDVRCLVKIVGDSTEAEFIRQFVQVFGVEKDFEYDGPPEDVRFYRAIAE